MASVTAGRVDHGANARFDTHTCVRGSLQDAVGIVCTCAIGEIYALISVYLQEGFKRFQALVGLGHRPIAS